MRNGYSNSHNGSYFNTVPDLDFFNQNTLYAEHLYGWRESPFQFLHELLKVLLKQSCVIVSLKVGNIMLV